MILVNITYQLRLHLDSISNINNSEQIKFYQAVYEQNEIKFYKSTFMNKIYFRFIDIKSYLISLRK
jgi:hypothetical protein